MDKDLIEEFYNENPQYHFIPLKEFNIICNSPFSYTRECFERAEDVRLKYLGTFNAVQSRLKDVIKGFNDRLYKGHITQEYYNNKISLLIPRLNEKSLKEVENKLTNNNKEK